LLNWGALGGGDKNMKGGNKNREKLGDNEFFYVKRGWFTSGGDNTRVQKLSRAFHEWEKKKNVGGGQCDCGKKRRKLETRENTSNPEPSMSYRGKGTR